MTLGALGPELWVLGTDTGVGKTVVSARLCRHFAATERVVYWKPIASGLAEGSDSATVAELAAAEIAAGRLRIHPESFTFSAPLSPHLAARLEGRRVDSTRVAAELAGLRSTGGHDRLLIEGVGGLLVPLDDDGELLADLVARLAMPALLVARSTLGTINHTLLSLEAARQRGITIAGIVLNGPSNPENRWAIEHFGQVEVVAELPWFEELGCR